MRRKRSVWTGCKKGVGAERISSGHDLSSCSLNGTQVSLRRDPTVADLKCAGRTELGSPWPKDEMAHEVCGSAKDQQYDAIPKQQDHNSPVVWLALGFFHEAPKLFARDGAPDLGCIPFSLFVGIRLRRFYHRSVHERFRDGTLYRLRREGLVFYALQHLFCGQYRET